MASDTRYKRVIVAIDGPAGAGKSTIAKALARELAWTYLDSGAIYRAITLRAMRTGVDRSDAAALCELVQTMDLRLAPEREGTRVVLDGEDVTESIRTSEVTNEVHHVAGCAPLRKAIIPLQRGFAEKSDLIAEGRDMGTVVFPDAALKFYLSASPEERARRRQSELRAKGEDATVAKVLADIVERDRRDSTRDAAPLRQADDATVVDTTDLTIEQVVSTLRKHIAHMAETHPTE